MRRGLKPLTGHLHQVSLHVPRARPPMRRGLKPRSSSVQKYLRWLPRARPPMRRGLKQCRVSWASRMAAVPRARPPMRRGLKLLYVLPGAGEFLGAARAAPYEKGTETQVTAAPAGAIYRRGDLRF